MTGASLAFAGVLAVLHRTTADGRRLDEPAEELTRPLPLSLVRPGDYTPAGAIGRVWRDGELIRYSGHLNGEHPDARQIAADIEAGTLVGMLDADLPDCDMGPAEGGGFVARSWRVMAATLLPAEDKPWPEVTLTLDNNGVSG